MAVRNPTQWAAPSGTGYITPSSGADIATQSGVTIETQGLVNLKINPNTYTPKYVGGWTLTTKSETAWQPASGTGYISNVGTELLTDNLGDFITDNLGNNIVTNPTVPIPKYPTQWTASGS